jgi:TusA-related sulfurtransferase/peroxiredoxin family protein
MNNPQKRIDCTGLRCPEPILNIARAARGLGAMGGELEIHADDTAFPIDLKSWCRSTNAELVSLDRQEQTFRAVVRVPQKAGAAKPKAAVAAAAPAAPAAPAPAARAVAVEPTLLDYRGRRCPEPIVELAKAARSAKGPLEVLADDPAFPLDLKSWCRSSGATMEGLASDGSLHRVLVFPKGVSRDALVTEIAPPAAAPVAPPPVTNVATSSPFPPGVPTALFDLRGLSTDAIDEELSHIGKLRSGMGVTLLMPPDASQRAVRWCAAGEHDLVAYASERVDLVLGARADAAHARSDAALVLARKEGDCDCAILVMSNNLENLLAALLVANAAAAMGMRTMLFFTFWGLNLLRADRPNLTAPAEPLSFMQRVFKWLMPKGPRRQGLGKLNFGGLGASIMGGIMQKQNIQDLPSLLASAQEQDVRFVACTMSMGVMGIGRRDLEPYPNLEFGGAATFVEAGRRAQVSLVF